MTPRDDIIDILRQRRCMEADDTSDDDALRAMSSRRAFEECCGWHLGDPQWAGEILRWLKGAGYSVTENTAHHAQAPDAGREGGSNGGN